MDTSIKSTPSESPVRRSGNCTADEDVAIAQAYIYVSTDAIVGAEQKGNLYNAQIHEAYKERKPKNAVLRSLASVETRLKLVLKEFVRFSACFKNVCDMNKSGVSQDDMVLCVTTLINKRTVSLARDDVGPAFKFYKAWEDVAQSAEVLGLLK